MCKQMKKRFLNFMCCMLVTAILVNVGGCGNDEEKALKKQDVASELKEQVDENEEETEVNGDEQKPVIKTGASIQGTVCIGVLHSGAITEDGSLYMWGNNEMGQIGNGSIEEQLTPVKVLSDVVSFGMQGVTSAAVTEDGSLYMWGNNVEGQIGNGSTENQLTPVKILSDVSFVSMTSDGCAAITDDGSLYMWGSNSEGQIGNGTTEAQLVPWKVLEDVENVYYEYTGVIAAITKDGSLYMWGNNKYGRIGNGSMEDQLVPFRVLSEVKNVSMYPFGASAITKDGSLYMWGNNEYGQIGNGTTDDQLIPVKVLSEVSFILPGDSCAAITTDGNLYTWGMNNNGQIGDGSTEEQLTPVQVLSDVVSVDANLDWENKTLNSTIISELGVADITRRAITEDGSLYTWGENSNGYVGNGNREDQLTPVQVLTEVVYVNGSNAITEDGSLYTWGYEKNRIYKDTGFYHNVCQLTPEKILSDIVSFDYAGTLAATTKDRDLYTWGINLSGTIGNGTIDEIEDNSYSYHVTPEKVLSDVYKVNFAGRYAVAITEDGSLYLWGDNASGQIGNGTTEDQLTPYKVLDNVRLPEN